MHSSFVRGAARSAPSSAHRQFLFRKIAWHLQARAEGSLPEPVRDRARSISQDIPLRTRVFANARKRRAGQPVEQTATTTITPDHDSRLPAWRPAANAPVASSAGTQLVAGHRNNNDRGAYVYLQASATGLHAYDVEDDDWFQLGSPASAGTFGAGAGAVMMPSEGPRGTLAGGATTSSIVLSTALSAAVAPNQLANKGNSNGFKIRIIGNSAGGSGKTEERYIIGNTGGTTPTLYLDSALSFTPASGDAYEILSGRLFLLGAGTLAAGIWKSYDIATNSFSGNLATTNLPGTIGTDSSFVGLDEGCVPYDANPGDGYFGQLTATTSTASTITGQAASGDAAVLANEYRNFQIRIVQDTTSSTAVGQRRNIASHTSGPSAVYTVSSNWTVTPSASAVFVIENNGDRILLWSSASTSTFTYHITANTWDTTTFGVRPAAMGAGCNPVHRSSCGRMRPSRPATATSSVFVAATWPHWTCSTLPAARMACGLARSPTAGPAAFCSRRDVRSRPIPTLAMDASPSSATTAASVATHSQIHRGIASRR